MRLGQMRSPSAVPKDATKSQIPAPLGDPALLGRVQLAARAAALDQLKSEGVELTPEQIGELVATLMLRKRDAGDVLAGSAATLVGILVSDRRCKSDVVRVATHPAGFGIYEYCYTGFSTRWRGVLAQEVAQTRPDAVYVDAAGYLLVDYAALGVSMEAV